MRAVICREPTDVEELCALAAQGLQGTPIASSSAWMASQRSSASASRAASSAERRVADWISSPRPAAYVAGSASSSIHRVPVALQIRHDGLELRCFVEQRPAAREQRAPRGGCGITLRAPQLARLGHLRSGLELRLIAPAPEPGEIVVYVAVERPCSAVGDQQEAVADRPQQRAVVRHQHEAAFEPGQRAGERVAHLEIEMVGRLVEQEQVRPAVDDQRQRETRFLTARERSDRRVGHIAAKIEATEVVPQVLLARLRRGRGEMRERRRLLIAAARAGAARSSRSRGHAPRCVPPRADRARRPVAGSASICRRRSDRAGRDGRPAAG